MQKLRETLCNQCGQAFGPGDFHFSSCSDHKGVKAWQRFAVTVDNWAASNTYGAGCFEADPKPYKLWLCEETTIGQALGILHRAGEFATFEGACLEAYLQNARGSITLQPVRFKPGVKRIAPQPIPETTKREIAQLGRQWLALRQAREFDDAIEEVRRNG